MTLRPMSALCILVLAGCASSEPQNVSYAPLAPEAAPAPTVMPPPPLAPMLQSPPGPVPTGQFPANGIASTPPPAPTLPGQPGQLPANGMAAAPPVVPGCHTVDDFTLCDVPADPGVDEIRYTN